MSKVLDSLEFIDNEYIVEAEMYTQKKKSKSMLKGVSVACLSLMLLGGIIASKYLSSNTSTSDKSMFIIKAENVSGITGDIIVKELSVNENPSLNTNIQREWKGVTEDGLREQTSLAVSGTIISKKECSVEYTYLDQKITEYWSVLTVKIDKSLYGESKVDTIDVLYELTSYDAGEFGVNNLPVEGEAYYFFLNPTRNSKTALDYSKMGDYFISIAPPFMTKVSDEPCDEIKVALDCQNNGDFERSIISFFK